MILRLIVVAMMLAAHPAIAADPIEGRWLTAADDNGNRGLIDVAACGAAFCGVSIKAYAASGAEVNSPNIGRQIIWNTTHKGDGVYRGKVYSPDRDKTYNSKLVLTSNGLSVSGCVLGVCRAGGTWRKQ